MKYKQDAFLLKKADSAVLRYLAEHPRPVGKATSVDALQKTLTKAGLRIERSEVIKVLKACAREGAGKFYVGRHGQKSRLVWLMDRTELAKRILEERGQLTGSAEITTLPATEDTARPEEEDETAPMLRYPFMLRNGLEITLELPTDLSGQEATRLSEFIKTLPLS